MASGFGLMALLYLLFSKAVPMISIWEMKVGLQSHGGGIITKVSAIPQPHAIMVLEGPLPTDEPE
jgi:hypothetical protein